MPFNKSFWISTAPPSDLIDEIIREAKEAEARELFVPKFEVSTEDFNGIIDSFRYLPGPVLNPKAIIKLEKENKKMKAKKCDRCGKLYEFPVNGENTGAEVRFRYLPVSDESDLSEKKIVEKQTKNIYINSISVDVDICPDCRESFKKWWESDGKK